MPYVTDAEKFRALWMTPAEAVAHVSAADKCPPDEAKSQIILALDDGNIPTIWADAYPEGPIDGWRADFKGDHPRFCSNTYLWNDTIINWDAGTTYDPNRENINSSRRSDAERAGNTTPKLLVEERPLLLLRESIEKLWPKDDGLGDEVDEFPILAEVPGSLTSQRPTITGDASSTSPMPPSPPKSSKSAAGEAFEAWWKESEKENGRQPTSKACDAWATKMALSREWVRGWASGLRTNKKGGRPAKPRS